MAFGIAGDNPGVGNQPSITMALIELRVMNSLLMAYLGAPQGGLDHIARLRNDEAFVLNVPTPLPGAGR